MDEATQKELDTVFQYVVRAVKRQTGVLLSVHPCLLMAVVPKASISMTVVPKASQV